MRIAMISTPFLSVPPQKYGGTELVVYELVEGLVDRGHEVTLFGTGDSHTRAELAFLYAKADWPPCSLAEINHLSWAVDRIGAGDFDLIHTHSAPALALSRFVHHAPIVYTLHHECVTGFSEFYHHFPDVQYIAISHNQKRLEAPLSFCEVIHHGLDPGRFQCADKCDDYVCFVGRFAEYKGPHIAIDAAKKAGLPIHIAGEVHPPDRDFAERELKQRLAQPHVTHLGPIGIAQKSVLLRQARALLAPIGWEEPFGLILIEAMLSGCPVVAFPRGSAPELVEEGITGFLARSQEEMAEIIRPNGVLETFERSRCRRRAMERFSRDRMVSDHVRLYEQVLTRGRQRLQHTQ